MGAAYKCDFCGKLQAGGANDSPLIVFRGHRVALVSYLGDRSALHGFPEPNSQNYARKWKALEPCDRCLQAILRALADAVEVTDATT